MPMPGLATPAVSVRPWPTVEGFALAAREVVDGACCTVTVIVLETAGELLPSPAYAAVRVWVPIARVEMLKVNVPVLVTLWVEMATLPSCRVRAPVGATPLPVRAAENVTAVPTSTGLTGVARVRPVVARAMVSTSGAEVLAV